MIEIPLHKTFRSADALQRVQRALAEGPGSFGPWTRECEAWLERHTGAARALLTTSATAALDCCALLLDLRPGDEVLMPSWTFPSAASAVVLRGAVPVFVDVRADTLNLDERLLADAITDRTRAIFVTHYAGVGCEMDAIMALAEQAGLKVVEDNAQGLLSRYRDRPLGSIGQLGVLSFNDTKNLGCGEGGALLINDLSLVESAEILRDKGTDRAAWARGEVTNYQWRAPAPGGPPAEITAALLSAQLEEAEKVTEARLSVWRAYDRALECAGDALRLPAPPAHCRHNGHIYHVRPADRRLAEQIRQRLARTGIQSAGHYQPLHQTRAGRYGSAAGGLGVTGQTSDTLLRLPLWPHMPEEDQLRVLDTLLAALGETIRGT